MARPTEQALVSDQARAGLDPSGFDPSRVIAHIATVASNIGWQAGVGGMETAGSIVSFLAAHPEHIPDFFAGKTSVMDWPVGWHEQGCLTWRAQNGKIVSPEHARRHRLIKKLEQGS